MGIEFPRAEIKTVFFLGFTVTGETFEIEGEVWDAVLGEFDLATKFISLNEKLLAAGTVKGHPVKLMDGGLDGVLDGMQAMNEGRISGVKMVYRIGK